MNSNNVQSRSGVTLVGAGAPRREDIVEAMALAPTLVAADGGANYCLAEGFLPQSVIGDFDSLDPATHAALPEAQFIDIHEQDNTDFEKAMSRIEAPFVLATGFTAGRLDHTLAVFSVMARRIGPPVIVLGDHDLVFAAPSDITLKLDAGTRVSLFPMASHSGRSTGLRWPIDGVVLDPVGQIGTSNEATGTVTLSFTTPGCLVILPREALSPAMSGLIG